MYAKNISKYAPKFRKYINNMHTNLGIISIYILYHEISKIHIRKFNMYVFLHTDIWKIIKNLHHFLNCINDIVNY